MTWSSRRATKGCLSIHFLLGEFCKDSTIAKVAIQEAAEKKKNFNNFYFFLIL